MKKIIINTIILGTLINFASAAEDRSFFGQIKSLFVKESVQVELKQESKEVTKDNKDQKQISGSSIMQIVATSSATSSLTTSTTTEESDETSSSTPIFSCEQEKKFYQKQIKTEKTIKEQNDDKNKISKSLIKIEGSVDSKLAKKISDKRIQLAKEVKDVTDIESDVVDLASSTRSIACDDDYKKAIKENTLKIKKLDIDAQEQALDVQNLIQKDIKDLIKNIK